MSLALDLYLGRLFDDEVYAEMVMDDGVDEYVCEATTEAITESVSYKLFEEELG